MPTLLSPLARKLCTARGIDPTTLRGSGPRGRIMAADVQQARTSPARRGHTAVATPALLPTRPEKDGYYVYDADADMKALADISLPIAVQCEKLLEGRYTLFNYIVRAVVKACTDDSPLSDQQVDVLLFEQKGEKLSLIADAGHKSIYRLAREAGSPLPPAADIAPHIIVCDSYTSREQVAAQLQTSTRPAFAFAARGGTPKAGITAGGNATSFSLPYTFYARATMPAETANRIAARLYTLLVDPVSLLLL